MKELLTNIINCTLCKEHLPLEPKPILRAHKDSKIVLIGQAPGRVVHKSGIDWDDQSGKQLRKWLGVSEETFYRDKNFAILPMAFCYPGKAKTGDLPPRKECAPQWHQSVIDHFESDPLYILIGSYACKYYLEGKENLTHRVKNYHHYLPQYFPIPHPSPVNRFWRSKNPWFETETVPQLQQLIKNKLS
ncbi:uracil-DNA glycosylase family protein [Mesonia sp. MT50]|uniref:Uracil-DNA glycosylase family protein n=1 Tax=Mesonia profundi TaxID=3070998 RepID=A0ABU0ZYX7_9FLAO|nr:uracil-DNA glycosylase family protein [Mesonia profundi]MDQ7916673.1 uracil-DNA glycosylase family protein [Mesonia profundi]